jgi:hypothetical protein
MIERMKAIYVAGPYSSPHFMQGLQNMEHGIRVGAELISLGFSVFCPFLDYQFIFFQPNLSREQYLAHSIEQMVRQDMLYVLKGWESSEGTKEEMKMAALVGLPIYYEDKITPEGLARRLLY